jgi:ATP synthase protein I
MSENLELPKLPETHQDVYLAMVRATFRGAAWGTLAAAALGVLLASVFVGWAGFFGALVGGALGVGSFLLTQLMMRQVAAVNMNMLMVAMLGGFLAKMLVLFGALTLLGRVAELHRMSLALTLLATIIVSGTIEAMAFRKNQVPTIIPAPSSTPSSTDD